MSQPSSSRPFPRIAAIVVSGLCLAITAFSTPLSVRCGTLTSVEIESASVRAVNVEKALTAGKVTPETKTPFELTEDLAPATGRAFVILTFDLNRGMSLGKTDYRLRLDGKVYPCLGLALGASAPFDPRRLAVVAEDSRQTVRALFEVPEGSEKATLTFSLPTTLPVEDVPLVLRESSPTPQADEQAAASAEDADKKIPANEDRKKPEPNARETGKKSDDAKKEKPKPKPTPDRKPKPKEKQTSEDLFDML